MSDPLMYFWIAVAALIALVNVWAIISVFRSDKSVGTKTLWALGIWIFPILGLICWAIAGPRGHGDGPQSPEHSK